MGITGQTQITLFVKKFLDDDFVILLLYVDDMSIVERDTNKIEKLKRERSQFFAMKDLGPAKQIFGMKITKGRVSKKLWLSQAHYIETVLEGFNMPKCKPVNTTRGPL